jgi:hypothetical protein
MKIRDKPRQRGGIAGYQEPHGRKSIMVIRLGAHLAKMTAFFALGQGESGNAASLLTQRFDRELCFLA